MKSTDNYKVCADRRFEATVDHCEEILENNPASWECSQRVSEQFKTLRDALVKANVPKEVIYMLDELDDSYVDLDTANLDALAWEVQKAFHYGFHMGMAYCEIEKDRS